MAPPIPDSFRYDLDGLARAWVRLAPAVPGTWLLAGAHAVNVLMLLLGLFLAAGLGATVGVMTAAAGLPEAVLSVPGAVVATLPILYWSWPVAVLAGVAPEETGRRGRRSSWYWRGPGYTSARRLLASVDAHRLAQAVLDGRAAAEAEVAGGTR